MRGFSKNILFLIELQDVILRSLVTYFNPWIIIFLNGIVHVQIWFFLNLEHIKDKNGST